MGGRASGQRRCQAGHSASAGTLPPRASLARATRAAPASASASHPAWALLFEQAGTPLSARRRQNAPPVAGNHRPPRRGASVAVCLHDRQREWPAGGRKGSSPSGRRATPGRAVLLRTGLSADHVVSDVLRWFSQRLAICLLFICFEKTRADSGRKQASAGISWLFGTLLKPYNFGAYLRNGPSLHFDKIV